MHYEKDLYQGSNSEQYQNVFFVQNQTSKVTFAKHVSGLPLMLCYGSWKLDQ